jgi:hypothetical protein
MTGVAEKQLVDENEVAFTSPVVSPEHCKTNLGCPKGQEAGTLSLKA